MFPRLSDCVQDNSESYELTSIKLFGRGRAAWSEKEVIRLWPILLWISDHPRFFSIRRSTLSRETPSCSSCTWRHSSKIRDFRFFNSSKFSNFIKLLKFVKIRSAILGLWAHSTGCSGALPQLINMQQQQINLGQKT